MEKSGNHNKALLVPIQETQDGSSSIYSKLSDIIIEKEFFSLIKDSCAGKRESQKKLYTVFYDYSIAICLRYASTPDDAIEIMNDAYLKMFNKLSTFKPIHENVIADFKAWLKKIMIFTAIDHCRKNNKHQYHLPADESLSLVVEDETQLEKISYKEILTCIQKLSPAYRAAFSLYVIDGFTHDEIAKQLGIAVGTSKSNLAKARMHLQQMLLAKQNFNMYEQRAV